MNKFAKVLLLALIVAAPVTAFASQAQAKAKDINHASVKTGKVHHTRHHRHHAKNITHK